MKVIIENNIWAKKTYEVNDFEDLCDLYGDLYDAVEDYNTKEFKDALKKFDEAIEMVDATLYYLRKYDLWNIPLEADEHLENIIDEYNKFLKIIYED